MRQEDIEEYEREKAVSDWVGKVLSSGWSKERIVGEITGRISEGWFEARWIKGKNEDLMQALKIVAHAIKTFGLCNPDVQLARLDPDEVRDWERVCRIFTDKKNPGSAITIDDLNDTTKIFLASHVLKGDCKGLEEMLGEINMGSAERRE